MCYNTKTKGEIIMTLYIFPEVNMKVEIEKNKISVYDNFTEKCVYQFEGVFIFKVLDNSNFMILEKCNKNDLKGNCGKQKLSFFRINEKGSKSVNSFCVRPNSLKLNKSLLSSKEIIIPGFYKDFIYSFEFDKVISDFYDRISFDEEKQQFYVMEEVLTDFGTMTLHGVLDIDGFLLNESMYSKELDRSFYINPFDKDGSIYELTDKFNKLMKRKTSKDYFTNLVNYERECYLTRKRKIPKQNSSSR